MVEFKKYYPVLKKASMKEYFLYYSIYIKCKLIYSNPKHIWLPGTGAERGIDCKGAL